MAEPIDDLLHEPSGERFWGEHYLFWGQDRDRAASFMLHFARMPYDVHLHRGLLLGFLPDDKLVLLRHAGPLRAPTGPGNQAIWAECIEPFKTWDVHVDGNARLVDRASLLECCMTDGPLVPVTLDVRFTTIAPPWEIGRAGLAGQKWASLRFEQGCSVSGTLAYGTTSDAPSTTHRMDGYGYRDHSVGVRHEASFRETTWITGIFPKSGRVIGILKIGGEAPWLKGYIADANALRDIVPLDVPAWISSDTIGDRSTTTFELDGITHSLRGEILHAAPQMNAAPNHIVMGMDRTGALKERLVLDQPSRLWLDDEEGYGHDQRTGAWGKW